MITWYGAACAGWAAQREREYRETPETPFTGPDLKTEKGPLPRGSAWLLSDGGCAVCGRRNVHAPECHYTGVLDDEIVINTRDSFPDAYPGISRTTNLWWGQQRYTSFEPLNDVAKAQDARATLIEYLKVKTAEGDWHAVSDAANDLRVLEAKS